MSHYTYWEVTCQMKERVKSQMYTYWEEVKCQMKERVKCHMYTYSEEVPFLGCSTQRGSLPNLVP